MIKSIVFTLILILAIAYLYKNLNKLFGYLKVAKPDKRTDNFGKRIANMIKVAFLQTKILRDGIAGPIHIAIYWGFLVLLFSASEGIFQGFYHNFSWNFLGPLYTIISFLTDIFCPLIIIAVLFALIRRFIVKVPRLQGDSEEKIDATIILVMILIIVTSLILEKSAEIHLHSIKWAYTPIAGLISNAINENSAPIIYEITWWIHILGILFFANYLPYSKHFHVYTSIPNTFFSYENIPNKLERIDFEQESIEKFGVIDINDLSWKNLFDSYSCTHCGRCTSVCPANLTGKQLSPREIIIQTRKRTIEAAPILLKIQQAKLNNQEYQPNEIEQKILDKKYVGDYLSIEALWQCTTCGACMQECPIQIEHVPVIIGARRNLVMMEANFPQELQPAFNDLENNASPWSFPQSERAKWAEGTGIKTCAEDPNFEILYWVGCAGSFDDRAKKISLAFAKLMQIAGINFRILGEEEHCNGDVARRSGNEYLADILIKTNVETLNRYNVKKIVTTCPHCFNTLKNEYPDFGGNYEVIHHTVFLQQLIDDGKLKIKQNNNEKIKIAYHDSCYLGRYNQIYDAPRKNLNKIPDVQILEPERTKDKGFCCGAGGAQMFMEEKVGKRVNIERTEELLKTGANCIAANCPFCMTMLTDGVKAKDKDEEIKVLDIAEILLQNIETE